MTNFKCDNCGTDWKTSKPQNKHLVFNESKTQSLQAGKGSCTCGCGEDGLRPH